MNARNDGGAAFPRDELRQGSDDRVYQQHDGMSLRDYFAGQALPGVITAIMSQECHRWQIKDFAHEAYALADAMLAAREAS